MARNTILVDAPPNAVFDVLADPRTYALWVVGSREVRAADAAWPAPGSSFDHTVGMPLLNNQDATTVLASQPGQLRQMRARARPLPTARVTLELESAEGGTRVVMTEEPMRRRLSKLMGPLGHLMIWLRNIVSLRRLKRLAEGVTELPKGELPPRSRPLAKGAGVG
jgi:uncharacterized protein YndB with AHSA1/START domain